MICSVCKLCSFIKIGLADGDGGVVDQPDEANIAEDFPIVPDHKMSDDCPDHGREEQAAGIKQEGEGERGEEEVQ